MVQDLNLEECVNITKKYLNANPLLIPHQDGRISSITNEDQIKNILLQHSQNNIFFKENKIKIDIPKERSWYDFSIISVDSQSPTPKGVGL